METTITKKIIFDHFENRTSPLQKAAIETWLNSTANEELFYEWLEEWERQHLQYEASTEKATERFFLGVDSEESLQFADDRPGFWGGLLQLSGRKAWLTAAVAVLAIGLGWQFRAEILSETYETSYGELKEFTLPDGSAVKLNANSSLKVPRWGFGKSNREVFLTGDASFHVTHLADNQKFVVRTSEQFEVVVLGTQFTMSARKSGSKVVLMEGKVRLQYNEEQKEKQLVMKPGDVVKFSGNDKVMISHTATPETYAAWENQRFVFEETTLEEVALQLQETYGVQITFSNRRIGGRRLMGSFRGSTMDELLQSIAEVLDISVSREKDKVVFSDK